MTRAFALFLAALLAGCATPATERGRTIPLDVPPASALLPAASELPDGYVVTRDAPQDSPPWAGVVDGHLVQFARGKDSLMFSAYSFESETSARAMFANATSPKMENESKEPWGDEAVTSASEWRGSRERTLFLRARSVVWIAADAQSDPFRDDLPPSAWPGLLLPRLARDA